jgi:starch phosphorylase
MATLTPRFSSVRMLQEYIERAYTPAALSYRKRAAQEAALARELDMWSRHLVRHWSGIQFGDVQRSAAGRRLTVSAPIYLGEITPDAVRVELYANPETQEAPVVGPSGEPVIVHLMTLAERIPGAANAAVYRATIETGRPPWHFTPRVVPYHPEARIPIELALIAWPR